MSDLHDPNTPLDREPIPPLPDGAWREESTAYPAEYRPPTRPSNVLPSGDVSEPKHSGLGIASFVMSLAVGLLILVVFGIAGVVQVSTPGRMDEKSSAAVLIGLGIIALVLVDLLALGLGIAGLVQKNRRRVFAVLGTCISGLTVLGTIVLVIVGNLMK